MPRPSLRTRSRKHVNVALPSGKSNVHYKKEVRPPKTCSKCGQPLAGSTTSAAGARKLNLSKKRIQRPYGGQLCSNCLKTAIKQTARTLKA